MGGLGLRSFLTVARAQSVNKAASPVCFRLSHIRAYNPSLPEEALRDHDASEAEKHVRQQGIGGFEPLAHKTILLRANKGLAFSEHSTA